MKKKCIIVQPSVPAYRLDFFNRLIKSPQFLLYSTRNKMQVTSNSSQTDNNTVWIGDMICLGPFLYQKGWNRIPIKDTDILVLWGNIRCISNWFLILKCRYYNKKFVLWSQFNSQSSIKGKVVNWWLALSDGVICYTKREAEILKHNISVKVGYLNNGLDKSKILHARQLAKTSDRKNIVFLGRYTEKSKLKLLFDALVKMPMDIKIRVDLIGVTESSLNDINLPSNIEIVSHGILVNEYEIAKIFANAKLFVYPGDVGLSLIHAMCYGVPIVIHDNIENHMPEISACDYYKGLVSWFQVGSAVDLCNSILDVLSSPSKIDEDFIKNKEFSTEEMANKFIEFVREM